MQIFYDQMVESFTRNKNSSYVTYPRWLALLFAHTGTDYNINHAEFIPFPIISSKIINVSPIDGDPHLNQCMENWVQNASEFQDA